MRRAVGPNARERAYQDALASLLLFAIFVVVALSALDGCSGVFWPRLIEVRVVGEPRDAGADSGDASDADSF